MVQTELVDGLETGGEGAGENKSGSQVSGVGGRTGLGGRQCASTLCPQYRVPPDVTKQCKREEPPGIPQL